MSEDGISTLRPHVEQQVLVTLKDGSPRVRFERIRFLGRLRVEGGELYLSDCFIESLSSTSSAGRRLSAMHGERAFVAVAGRATLMRTTLRGHLAGAIGVHGATLLLVESSIRESHAQSGGAMLVAGAADVTVVHSELSANSAEVSGGALQVICVALPTQEGSIRATSDSHWDQRSP